MEKLQPTNTIAVPITSLYLADNHLVSTLAGTTEGFSDGNGSVAQFFHPNGVCVDIQGNVIVADHSNNKIRKISTTGIVSTLAGTTWFFRSQFSCPVGVCVDIQGNVIVADQSNHRIRKISTTGIVSTLAGTTCGFSDGNGSVAQFNSPYGVCVDIQGNVIVADVYNHKIRKISTTGTVSTLAGTTGGFSDGNGSVAQFYYPCGVCVDIQGNIIVADQANQKVRKISLNREIQEREAREKAEREAREKAEREAREKAEREAREKADREAREKVEREAREKADMEAREKAVKEAREKSEREAREKAEREDELLIFLKQLDLLHCQPQLENYGVKTMKHLRHLDDEEWKDISLKPFEKKLICNELMVEIVQTPNKFLNKQTFKNTTLKELDPIVPTPNPKPIPVIHNNEREQQRHREPPTARTQPGKRFLDIVPNCKETSKKDIINCLITYAKSQTPPLDTNITIRLEDKIEDFEDNHLPDEALSLALCWLYTTESWVYQQTNFLLREDSRLMTGLAPFMNVLMASCRNMSPDYHNHGTVFRRLKLTETGVNWYKPGTMFVWSSFTSTTCVFSEDDTFGDILFVISIPKEKSCYAVSLEHVSDFPTEKEVLLLPNVGYIVTSVKRGNEVSFMKVRVQIEVEVKYVCV